MTEQINPGSINITPANASAASALIGDPSKFGRVADDGTVYVRTSEGEKAVGSYPGKTAEEALQYFVRKFEAVASEVALTAARITSGAVVPDDAYEAVKKLRQQVRELNGVGKNEGTTWLNCSLFGKRGEALAQYITKGSQVAITGEILLNTYKGKDGTEKSSLECRVNNVTLLGGKTEPKPTLRLVENDTDLSDVENDIPF